MIELDDKEAARTLAQQAKDLSPKVIKRAEVSALNRAVRGARTEMSAEIRDFIAVKARDVKDATSIDKARITDGIPTAVLKVKQSLLPVTQFSRPNQTRKGVAVTIRKGKRQTIEGGFIPHEGGLAFIREGDVDRYPIKMLFGPSVRQLAPEALKRADGRIRERVVKQLEHNLNRAIEKAAKR